MAQTSTKIKKYCKENGVLNVDFKSDVLLRDEGDGIVYISEWNLDIPQPTTEQLDSYENVANTEEANNTIIAKRKSLYGSWDKQLEEINEQGLDAWKERIAQIKADNPKEKV